MMDTAKSDGHGIKIVRHDDGCVELLCGDQGPVRVCQAQIRSLVADMVIPNIPPAVFEAAMLLFAGDRAHVAWAYLSPAPGLGEATPMEKCATAEGQAEVVHLYKRILYGIHA